MIDADVLVESKYWKKIIQNPKRLILNIFKNLPNNYKFINKKVNISVLLTTNKKIKYLNKKFRKKINLLIFFLSHFLKKKELKKKSKKKNYI